MTALPDKASPIAGAPLGLATAHGSVLIGLEARPVRIEVCCTRGPAFFQMVGLAEAAVREARVRVASALAGFGVLLSEYAITVNLARPREDSRGPGGYGAQGFKASNRADVGYGNGGFGGGRY